MLRSIHRPALALLLAGVALPACSDQTSEPLAPDPTGPILSEAVASTGYVVLFKGNGIPADFAAQVESLGGTVSWSDDRMGMAVAAGLSADAAEQLGARSDVHGIAADARPPAPPRLRVAGVSLPEPVASPELASPGNPAAALLYPLVQWNMGAIGADKAWAAGMLGSDDVKVAILDSGVDPTHPDLQGRVDVANSRSFVPEDSLLLEFFYPGAVPWIDLNGHGTNVAATVSSNGYLAAGVTSRTRLLAVKVSGELGGSWSAVARGIAYAADQDADVINMSLGLDFPHAKNGLFVAQLINRAVTYAYRKGTLVVVAAGNAGLDLDHDGNNYNAFCNTPTLICVSATGPRGPGVLTPELEGLDDPAVYTNFGRSAITVAAPGGSYTANADGVATSGGFIWAACPATRLAYNPATRAFRRFPCDVIAGMRYDLMVGTSQASPHVAGLAALLVARHGKNNPAEIRSRIQNSADDLGQSGTDPYYGKGRINVARALGL